MNCNKCGHSWTPKISPKWDKFQTGEANFDQPFNPELHNTPTRCPKCYVKIQGTVYEIDEACYGVCNECGRTITKQETISTGTEDLCEDCIK